MRQDYAVLENASELAVYAQNASPARERAGGPLRCIKSGTRKTGHFSQSSGLQDGLSAKTGIQILSFPGCVGIVRRAFTFCQAGDFSVTLLLQDRQLTDGIHKTWFEGTPVTGDHV